MAKVALLIGVSEYEPGLNPLPSAVRDVEAVYEVLLHTEMGGFAASDITLLKNPERQVVEMAIETLFSNRHKDDLLLLYFSGHGIKDDRGRLYLATRNTSKTQQGELIRSTSVSMQFEYPLSDATREELQRFQDILELSAQEVAQIEAKSIENSQVNKKEENQNLLQQHNRNNQNLERLYKAPLNRIIAIFAGFSILVVLVNYNLIFPRKNEFFSPLTLKNQSIQSTIEENLQIVDQVIEFPEEPIPNSYYKVNTVSAKQVNYLNNLFKKFKKVDNSFEPVKLGSATTYQEWNALCIGEGFRSTCPKSASHEIISRGDGANKLFISRGWVIYKR